MLVMVKYLKEKEKKKDVSKDFSVCGGLLTAYNVQDSQK